MIADRSRIRLAGFLALAAIHLAATWCPAQSVQEPAPRGGPPQVWAVLVGIERYEDEVRFPRSRGAGPRCGRHGPMADRGGRLGARSCPAPDRSRALRAGPFPESRPAARPPRNRRGALERAISDWLTPRARPGDVALIFFAGQAVSLPPAKDGAGRPPRDYLIPWDGVREKEETWWRPGDAIDGLARRHVAIVCLLDTSPAGRIQPPRIDGVRREVAPEHRLRLLEGIARWPGVTAWMAATDRTAGETDDGHGLLTSALIKALGTRGGQALGLHACLQRLRRDRALAGQGFRTVGEFAPGLSLWPNNVRLTPPKVDPLLQRGHADRVTGIAFRSDGGRMITASMDSTVRVWRTSDSFLLQAIPWTSNGYHSLDLGGDGRLLVAGGGKGDVLFFDTATETRLTWPGLPQHAGPVSRVAVLADGRHAVTLDNLNGRCTVWDVDLGAARSGPWTTRPRRREAPCWPPRRGPARWPSRWWSAARTIARPSASSTRRGRSGTRSRCPSRRIAKEPPRRNASRPSASPMTVIGSSWGPRGGGWSTATSRGIGPGPIARCRAARSGRSRSSRSG